MVGLALVLAGLALRPVAAISDAGLHTIIETVATVLALVVGVLALVRHYSKPDTTLLVIGAAFVGTASLDGYHAVVTSGAFSALLPSAPASLIPWSWIAARTLLSISFVLSWYLWRREEAGGLGGGVPERAIYLLTGVATLAAVLFFAFVPLPRAYFPELATPRPAEFVPALFFLIALAGYLHKGRWRRDAFDHWLVLSLIVGSVGQAVMMSSSGQLFDAEFVAAHALKIVSYVCVLIGLLISMSSIFRESSETTFTLAEANVSLKLEAAERQRAEQERRDSERRFRDLAEVASDWFWETDADLRFSYVSPKVTDSAGVGPEWYYGKMREDLIGPDYDREVWDEHLQTLKDRLPFRDFTYLWGAPGLPARWLRVSGMPVFSADGQFLGYRGVAADITKYREAEEELKVAMEIAEQANNAKSDFLSSMSHELRTPLNSILGFSQLMTSDPKTNLTRDQRDSVEHISRAGRHLLELINEVLDLSKIESGRMALSIEGVEIGAAFDSVVRLTENLAAARNIKLNADYESVRHQIVRADITRLRQVLLNLLSNAVKYNDENGAIHLHCRSTADDTIRVSVRDSGKGLPAEHLERIFEPFTRLGAERSEVEGTGIGLTITKRLVEMMGGDIGVDSSLGAGSTFWFELPRGEASAAGPGAPDEAGPLAPAVVRGGGPRRVLYIEDNPSNLRLMERIFARRADLELISAPNAEIGIELARVEVPDLVLMDISLPGMDGFEALRNLRDHRSTRAMPVIAVTANATVRDIERGREAGFQSYLTKPLNVGEILDAIDATLNGLA